MAKNKKQKAKQMAAKGKSPAQIKAKTGVGSKTAQSYVAKHSPAPSRPAPAPSRPAPAPKPAAKISKNNSLSKNLKIAGRNQNISKRELQKITKKNDVSGAKAVKRLDKLNSKNKNLKIGVGSAAVKAYTEGKMNNQRDLFWSQMGNNVFGSLGVNKIKKSGKIASTLNDSIGDGVKAGRLPPITPGNQVNARGGITTKPTFYNTRPSQPTAQPTPTTAELPPTQVETDPVATEPQIPFIPEPLPEEEMDPGVGMMAGGGMGAAGANKLGRARSRVRRLGIQGRGTGLLGRGLQYGNALN